MNKKLIASAAVIAAAASMSAANAQDITVTIDGTNVAFDQPPIIDSDRTLVPMRAIFEALGADVQWDGENRTVTSVKGETTIKLTIDSPDMYVGENKITLDVPAKIVNDRTLVPVRAISEAMSCKVDWDGEKQQVVITTETVPEATEVPETTAEPEATETPEVTAVPAADAEEMAPEDGVNTYVHSLVAGEINPSTGEVDSSQTEKSTTNFVPVNGGKTYYAAVYHPNALSYSNICKGYAFYDKDKKYISGDAGDMSALVKAPDNAAYIRYTIELPVTSRNTLYVNFMETSVIPTDFAKSESITKNAKTDKLNDKSIYMIVDGSVRSSDPWLTMLDEQANAKQLYIKSEDGLRYTGSTGVALAADSYIAGLPKSGYDALIVYAGSYDWMQNMKTDDFEKAVTKFVESAKKQVSGAEIYLATIPTGKNGSFADGVTNANGASNADYSAIIKKVAEAEKVNVIDIASLWNKGEEEKYLQATDGGLFMFANEAGSEKITNAVIDALTK